MAESFTDFVSPPFTQRGWVALQASGRRTEGMQPTPALNPKRLQKDAGILIEPPASPPSAMGTSPAATAAALPPLEPPELYSVLKGVEVGPNMRLSVVPLNP